MAGTSDILMDGYRRRSSAQPSLRSIRRRAYFHRLVPASARWGNICWPSNAFDISSFIVRPEVELTSSLIERLLGTALLGVAAVAACATGLVQDGDSWRVTGPVTR